jgi:hypothetical protein
VVELNEGHLERMEYLQGMWNEEMLRDCSTKCDGTTKVQSFRRPVENKDHGLYCNALSLDCYNEHCAEPPHNNIRHCFFNHFCNRVLSFRRLLVAVNPLDAFTVKYTLEISYLLQSEAYIRIVWEQGDGCK